jgi:hypothetical protein
MSTEKISHTPTPRSKRRGPNPVENTTDATRGEPLTTRARKRVAELEEALDNLPDTAKRERSDIELALASVSELLTGNQQRLSEVTASELNRWLENTKHLAEMTPREDLYRTAPGNLRETSPGIACVEDDEAKMADDDDDDAPAISRADTKSD